MNDIKNGVIVKIEAKIRHLACMDNVTFAIAANANIWGSRISNNDCNNADKTKID